VACRESAVALVIVAFWATGMESGNGPEADQALCRLLRASGGELRSLEPPRPRKLAPARRGDQRRGYARMTIGGQSAAKAKRRASFFFTSGQNSDPTRVQRALRSPDTAATGPILVRVLIQSRIQPQCRHIANAGKSHRRGQRFAASCATLPHSRTANRYRPEIICKRQRASKP
jgi:hypothetical protein